jgi:hypothetical protein
MIAVLIFTIVVIGTFIISILILALSYIFGTDTHEDGGLRECIGCPIEDKEVCEKECRYYKNAEKKNGKSK